MAKYVRDGPEEFTTPLRRAFAAAVYWKAWVFGAFGAAGLSASILASTTAPIDGISGFVIGVVTMMLVEIVTTAADEEQA